MNSLALHLITYFSAFALVWFGAGLTVNAVSSFARSWKLPSFMISFFLLGMLTSLPEATIGGFSVLQGKPSIFVGNLLGSLAVLFLGIIPLLAIVNKGITIPKQFNKQELIFTLLVAVAPAIFTADQRITRTEGFISIAAYISLFVFLSLEQSLMGKIKSKIGKRKSLGFRYLGKLIIGVILLVGASQHIVSSTLYFAQEFHISPFFIGLVVVALGTNIPELSIVFRSIVNKKPGIALADYLGSASANTFLFGIFAAVTKGGIQLPDHFLQRTAFISIGLILFFVFARSKRELSRREGFALFGIYVIFILFEMAFAAL